MSDENKIYWSRMCKPPTEALKKITGGDLNGMSSIDPMWRIMAMTEIFGPCGIGWKYEIIREWREETTSPSNNNGAYDPMSPKVEISAHVEVRVYFKHNGEWSAPIPGVGGSMLLAQQKRGGNHSDEAFKMALTDALSVAFKSLGMAADVYMGKFDGSKYNDREDLLQEPDPMTPAQIEELNRWKEAFEKAGEWDSVGFIKENMTRWNQKTAAVWIAAYNKDSAGFKTW